MLREVAGFVWRHRAYLLLAPVLIFFGTLVHESAHALAAIAQGATITDFTIVPGMHHGHFAFGFTDWVGLPDEASRTLVMVAPSLLSTLLASATLALVSIPRVGRSRPVKVLLVLGFLTPMLDVAQALTGVFFATEFADLYEVFYPPTPALIGATLIYFAAFGFLGYRALRRHLGETLSASAYAFGFSALMLAPALRRLFAP